MWAIPIVMSTFYIKVKVHAHKQMLSLVTGDVLSLFNEIARTIQAFLPACLNMALQWKSISLF